MHDQQHADHRVLYYVKCKGTPVKASLNYDEVFVWRNEISALALDEPRLCQEPHSIQSRRILLP